MSMRLRRTLMHENRHPAVLGSIFVLAFLRGAAATAR
jgi:hypothetical protein